MQENTNQTINILKMMEVTSIAVATDDTAVYSKHFPLPASDGSAPFFGIEYQATSGGNVVLKIELEQGNLEPTNDLAADGDYVIPDAAAEINDTLTDELVHIKAYSPAASSFARFKITPDTGNAATTVISKLKVKVIR